MDQPSLGAAPRGEAARDGMDLSVWTSAAGLELELGWILAS